MGLRLQGLVWTLGLSLGLGGLGLAALTQQLRQNFNALEQEDLRRDARRLQAGLAEVVAQRGLGAREWSHWTQMRDFVRQRTPGFAERNLTPTALNVSGLAWLAVLDLEAKPVWQVGAAGQDLQLAALLDPAEARGRRLRQVPSVSGGCTLERWQQRLQVICQLPIRDSEASDAPSGLLLTGEFFDEARLQGLRTLMGLDFDLLPAAEATGELLDGAPEGARLQRDDARHLVRWPLQVADEAPHSLLELRWSRDMREPLQRMLHGGQAVLLGLALALAGAVLLLIEFRLVQRLRRLQRQLAVVRGGEQWAQRLPVDGRDEVAALAEEGNHLLARIETQMARLEALSRTDALTGLVNRRGFEEGLQQALLRARRSGEPLALLLLDVDHFKRFNDQHGHPAGDRALQILAQGMRDAGARRGDDICARWGGEEFVLLLEGCAPELARERFAALQAWLRDSEPAAQLAAPMTVSAGLAMARPEERPETLLQRADDALYRAKQGGRNRVETAA